MESDVPKLQPITNKKPKAAAEAADRGGQDRYGFSRGRGNYGNLVYYGAQHNRQGPNSYGNGRGRSYRDRHSMRETEDLGDKRENMKETSGHSKRIAYEPNKKVYTPTYFPPKPRYNSSRPGYRTSGAGYRYQPPGYSHNRKPYGFSSQPPNFSHRPNAYTHQPFNFVRSPFGTPPPPPGSSPPLPTEEAPQPVEKPLPPVDIPLPIDDIPLPEDDIPFPPVDMPMSPADIPLPPDNKALPTAGKFLAPIADVSSHGVILSPYDTESSSSDVELSPNDTESSPPGVELSFNDTESSPPGVELSSNYVEPSASHIELPPNDVERSQPNVELSPPDVEFSSPNVEPTAPDFVPSKPGVAVPTSGVQCSLLEIQSSSSQVQLSPDDAELSPPRPLVSFLRSPSLSPQSSKAASTSRPWYRPPTDMHQAEESRVSSTSQPSGFKFRTLGNNNRMFVKYSPNIPLPQLNIPAEEERHQKSDASEFSGPRIYVSTKLFGPPGLTQSTESTLEALPAAETPTLGMSPADMEPVDSIEQPSDISREDTAPAPNGSLTSSPCAATRTPRVHRDRHISISSIGSPILKPPRRRNLSESQSKDDFLLEKIVSMDKASILDIINRTGTKYDDTLLNAANNKFREDIRERLQQLSCQLKKSKTDNIVLDGVIDAMNLPEAFLEEIRSAFKADIFKNERWAVKKESPDVGEHAAQPQQEAHENDAADADVRAGGLTPNGTSYDFTNRLQCPLESAVQQVGGAATRSHSPDDHNTPHHYVGHSSPGSRSSHAESQLLTPVIRFFEKHVLPFEESIANDYQKDSRSKISKLHFILSICTGQHNPRTFSKMRIYNYRRSLKHRRFDDILPFLQREMEEVRSNLIQKRINTLDMALGSSQATRTQSEEPEAEKAQPFAVQMPQNSRESALEQASISDGQNRSPQHQLSRNGAATMLGASETLNNNELESEEGIRLWKQRVADAWSQQVGDSWKQRVAELWSPPHVESTIKEAANSSSPAAVASSSQCKTQPGEQGHGRTVHDSEARQSFLASLSPTPGPIYTTPNDLSPLLVNFNALRQRTAMYEQSSTRLTSINEQLREVDRMRAHITTMIAGLQQELREADLLTLQLRHKRNAILSQGTPIIPGVLAPATLANRMQNYSPSATSAIPNAMPNAASAVDDSTSATPNVAPNAHSAMLRPAAEAGSARPSTSRQAIHDATSSSSLKRPAAVQSLPTAPLTKSQRLSAENQSPESLQSTDVISTGTLEAVSTTVTQICKLQHCILAAGEDGKLYTFNSCSLKLEARVGKHTEAITKMLTFPGDRTFYTTSLDGYLKKTAETALGDDMQALYIKEPLTALDIAEDVAFIGTADGHVYTHATRTEPLAVALLCSMKAAIIALRAARENGCRIVIISAKTNVVQIHDAASGALMRTITVPHSYHVQSFHLDDAWLFCITQRDKTYKFDWISGVAMSSLKTGRGVTSVDCYRNKFLLVGCSDGLVYIFNNNTSREVARLPGPGKLISALRIVGNKVIVAAKNQQMQVFELPEHIVAETKSSN